MIQRHVLLVDDEEAFVETMAKRLEKKGYLIAKAFNGEQAIQALSEGGANKFDVVVLDVKMPGMDGLEALEAIKSKHPTVEVLMLTGHGTIESAIEGMKRGAFDYLTKPCEQDLLIAKLEQAIARKKQHEAKILEAKVQAYALQSGI